MEAMKYLDHLIIPDVLDEAPPTTCDVVFPSGAKAILGNEIPAKDVKEQPSSVRYPFEKGAYYTLLIADVDTQNPEKNEGVVQWQQWVVMNIPDDDMSKGQVLSEYIGSGPLPGTGLHRYLILVFKQSSQLRPQEPYYNDAESDRKFSVRDFIKKYDLGKPIAANFYQTKYDDSVRKLYNENQP